MTVRQSSPDTSSFRALDPDKVVLTITKLANRIDERFHGAGLVTVAQELETIATKATSTVARIERPYTSLRLIIGVVLTIGALVLGSLLVEAVRLEFTNNLSEAIQSFDAAMSLTIVFGGGALFLSTLEGRWRREMALKALHEIRSIVHVIDMHQLTKDPSAFGAPRTSSSPDRSMTVFELLRYLGYCSELLSLASKVAALYADRNRDPAVINAVGDIERLGSELSQKIWQKIELVEKRAHLHHTTQHTNQP